MPSAADAQLGHYFVGNTGDVDATGWSAAFRTTLASRVHGSVEYSTSRTRWSGAGKADDAYLLLVTPAAGDEVQWMSMVKEMWRVLKPGGIFFARLASSIGIEDQVRPIANRRYRLPDGSQRFLVDEAMLLSVSTALGGEFIEPIKTTVVQNMRAMTTWCLRK